ncbi:uncharacterized protein N7484_000376 [Penicillium longicatenatum]|uniref:uncharacterized protein n=1 Tax=Penicillium longicatenatum TaxID=1561947 RepID=UPI0025490587|nr:uncharacterized protein N7484_000376 [Penicillium longicatenatum]KAJ5661004.1 hypothetical protein N7484_000376 [Penicillium longicatenatum]
MTTPRLPFLYPNLIRAIRPCEPKIIRAIPLPRPRRSFHTSHRRKQQAYHRRYGPAVEPNIPPPLHSEDNSSKQPAETSGAASEEVDNTEGNRSSSEQSLSQPPPQPQEQAESQPSESQKDPADAAGSYLSEQVAADSAKSNASAASAQPQEQGSDAETTTSASASFPFEEVGEGISQMSPYANTNSSFEEVYHMPSPSTYLTPTDPSNAEHKPPHMSPAPYVHHFDTYSLVQDLSKGGFTHEQSTTIMKAVRTILQKNLDFAQQSLTSKSDEENESYLFKAACSELQQSLQTARASEVQRQRASRGQLEHETDILSQRLNQELAGMKDEIKGMFNDHKMSTREQQRVIDTSDQELNYKITVSLNSDGKSEIEGLRWILTRRAAMAVATCAFMMILFLKYASTRKPQEPAKAVEVEKPVKEVTKETRVIHETPIKTKTPSIAVEHLGESLG